MPEGQEIPSGVETQSRLKAVFETLKENPKVQLDAALAGSAFALGVNIGRPELGAVYAALSLLVRPAMEKIASKGNAPYAVPEGAVKLQQEPQTTPQLLIEAWKSGVPQTSKS